MCPRVDRYGVQFRAHEEPPQAEVKASRGRGGGTRETIEQTQIDAYLASIVAFFESIINLDLLAHGQLDAYLTCFGSISVSAYPTLQQSDPYLWLEQHAALNGGRASLESDEFIQKWKLDSRSSIHLEMLITAQLDRSGERREFDGPRRRARNIKENLVWLGVKVHVVLRCAAVWTVICKVAILRVLDNDLSVVGPSAQLPREGVVDCPDIRDGKSVEGLAGDPAARAMDADHLDGRMASLAGRRRGGNVHFGRGDSEFRVVLRVRQSP